VPYDGPMILQNLA